MSETIQVDIVTPEKKIFSETNILSSTVPGVEGDMGILNNHIPIITFLRPGKIHIQSLNKETSFFISDGVLEFNNNILTILASEIYDIESIDSAILDQLRNKAKTKIQKEGQTDNESYLSSRFQEEVNQLSSSK
jgi:F-type H+-transporting ATPase subunit epsilon